MAVCKCKPWKRDRNWEYERSCRIGKRTFRTSTHTWGGDVTVYLDDGSADPTSARFPHVGPTCRVDEAKAYADRWLSTKCQQASGLLSGRKRRR